MPATANSGDTILCFLRKKGHVPAILNIELCEKFGLKALDFDGETDSIFHPFDAAGNRHMEYLEFRGEFAEVPIDQLRETYIAKYDHWKSGERVDPIDFEAEVLAETANRN